METKQNHFVRGAVLTVLGGMLWGLSGTCAQYLIQVKGFVPEWLTPVRLLCAGLLMLLWLLRRDGKRTFSLFTQRHHVAQIVVFAIFGMAGCQYTYFVAVQHSNAGTATVLQYLGPSIILLYVCIRSRTAPRLDELAGVGLSVLGTVLLATHGNLGALAISGAALTAGLLSAGCQAVYTVQPGRLMLHFDTPTVICWGMLVGGVVLSAALRPWRFSPAFDAPAVLAIIVVVLLGTIAAFCAFLQGVKYLGPTTGSLLACVEPVSALIFSSALFHTRFQPMDLLGFACILATIFVLALGKRHAMHKEITKS